MTAVAVEEDLAPTNHRIYLADARTISEVWKQEIHLVVTSPPYFNLKKYRAGNPAQLGDVDEYDAFLDELDKVWEQCLGLLVPGGRVCCVVGDVCVSRRQGGRHFVLPLSADIQVRARKLGFDILTPIRWLKVANITLEASRSARYLGKPGLPNGVVKNDLEHILFLRKPGGYRSPTPEMEEASRISREDYATWFSPIWDDVTGASTRDHPAPYPVEIARRLIRMFSFAGDTVLDPFLGTATTTVAAIETERSSVGFEIEPTYVDLALRRLGSQRRLFGNPDIRIFR